MLKDINLVIVTSVMHYQSGDSLVAYGPYVREIDAWAELFGSIVIAAPCSTAIPPADCLAFASRRISVRPVTHAGGSTFGAKLRQLLVLPKLVAELCAVLYEADAIHVRCPGNLGLLGAVLAPIFSSKRFAKYAGQWGSYVGEPRTSALQRWILRSRWWNAPVTVYGRHVNQPSHIVPFFTSILDGAQIERAREVANGRSHLRTVPLRILYVGRLSKQKNIDVLISAVADLRNQGSALDCTIIGEGAERPNLDDLARASGAADIVHFVGGLSHEAVLRYYEQADVLVLASETEGWPKAIAEAMAFGVVCIGSDRGLVSRMLSEGRGLTVVPRDVIGLKARLRDVASHADEFASMRMAAASWSQQFSLAGLREALRCLLETRWGSPANVKSADKFTYACQVDANSVGNL